MQRHEMIDWTCHNITTWGEGSLPEGWHWIHYGTHSLISTPWVDGCSDRIYQNEWKPLVPVDLEEALDWLGQSGITKWESIPPAGWRWCEDGFAIISNTGLSLEIWYES